MTMSDCPNCGDGGWPYRYGARLCTNGNCSVLVYEAEDTDTDEERDRDD